MQDRIPFERTLKTLQEEHGLADATLRELSDLTATELSAFKTAWGKMGRAQREKVSRRLVRLVEDDTLLDFDSLFVHLLADEAVAVRLAALSGLWDTSRSAHVPTVVAMMQADPDVEVRAASAHLLGGYVYQSFCGLMPRRLADTVFPHLVAQLDDVSTPSLVRQRALEAASYGADEQVHRFILQAYEDGDGDMQVAALTAMGISGDSRWLSVIMDELESPFAEIRFAAARASGQLGDPDVTDQLVRLIEDDLPEIKAAALASLAAIGGEAAQRILASLVEDPEYDDLRDEIDDALDDLQWSNMLDDYMLIDFDPDDFVDDDSHFSDN